MGLRPDKSVTCSTRTFANLAVSHSPRRGCSWRKAGQERPGADAGLGTSSLSKRSLKDESQDPERTLKADIQDHTDTPYPACQETPGEEDDGRPPELDESSDDGDDGDENEPEDCEEESESEDE